MTLILYHKEEKDPLVQTMIDDILSDSLHAKAWSEAGKKKCLSKTRKDDLADDLEMSKKNKKMKGKKHGEVY